MTASTKKDDTLKLRMDAATTALLERARGYVKLDRSKFIRASIREKAEAILEDHEKTVFTEDDWGAFFEALDHPPELTDTMKRAVQRYQDLAAQHEL